MLQRDALTGYACWATRKLLPHVQHQHPSDHSETNYVRWGEESNSGETRRSTTQGSHDPNLKLTMLLVPHMTMIRGPWLGYFNGLVPFHNLLKPSKSAPPRMHWSLGGRGGGFQTNTQWLGKKAHMHEISSIMYGSCTHIVIWIFCDLLFIYPWHLMQSCDTVYGFPMLCTSVHANMWIEPLGGYWCGM